MLVLHVHVHLYITFLDGYSKICVYVSFIITYTGVVIDQNSSSTKSEVEGKENYCEISVLPVNLI